jgi:hypothetical protein
MRKGEIGTTEVNLEFSIYYNFLNKILIAIIIPMKYKQYEDVASEF